MKKILVSSLLASSLAFGATPNENLGSKELTGDTKLSCEAILCLSSGVRPGECAPSIARFFAITAKTMAETIAKRKSFLNLCPVGDTSNNASFVALRDNVLVNMNSDCTASFLNSRIEQKEVKIEYPAKTSEQIDRCGNTCVEYKTQYRINPNMPYYCKALIEHEYTDKNLKYNCDGAYVFKEEFKGEKTQCWSE